MKISTIFHFASLVRIIDQAPEFIFTVFFRDTIRVLHGLFLGKPVAFKLVTEGLEVGERVFITILEAIVATSSGQAFDTVPFRRRQCG
jgi:hypothetical protein